MTVGVGVQAVQMSSTGFVPNTTGLGKSLSQQLPEFILIETNDTLANVTATGYLNESRQKFGFPYNNQQMALVYTTDNGGQTQWLNVVVSGTAPAYNYSLESTTDVATTFVAGLGSVAAPSYTFVGRTDTGLYSSAAYTLDVAIEGSHIASFTHSALQLFGNITAGASGTAGKLISYPAGVTSGYLALTAVNSSGDYQTNITNASMGQSTTMVFADPGNVAGRFLVAATNTPFVSGNIPIASGTGGLMVDSGISGTSATASALGVLTSTVTLTAAQVIAAYATPQVLIPAVAGKVAVIISAIVYTNSTGHTAFATGVAPIIQYGDTVHGAGTIAVGAGLVTADIEAAASQIRTLGAAASTTYTGITDTDVTFSCTTAYTAGTGSTVTFQLTYTYITATI